MTLAFEGVLFFPVTPFDDSGRIDEAVLESHIRSGVDNGAGGVFVACGTGEFHALDPREVLQAARVAVRATEGRAPVLMGVGGPVATASALAREAQDVGVDGLLLLPPYLVAGPGDGLAAWVEAILAAGDLPVVLYNRGSAVYPPAIVRRLAANPRVIGFKDGVGDLAAVQRIVSEVTAIRTRFLFFNGLLTAELSQGAYRGVGVPLYSSAAFAMAPGVATAFHRAYLAHDEAARLDILNRFYVPLVALRDETPGFGVSLIKAGLRLRGVPVGPVRPPLTDPNPDQLERLASILDVGDELAREHALRTTAGAFG
ncbi:5-dehydro-4-deoxyglucarate dehydratase [Microbacterium sp. NPDC019599]|uniref:5-dehydro-4-deoxyglucarate dehydratase n=1 Tax=Microbacterium sp. NPDC019599 TaxID=3154690 RepID=UPI0033C70C7A